MTSSNGNIFRVTGPLCGEFTGPGEFPTQRPVTRSFDVFFDLRPNKRLSKQPRGWWFETPSWSLWRHRNGGWKCNYYPSIKMGYNYWSMSLFYIYLIGKRGDMWPLTHYKSQGDSSHRNVASQIHSQKWSWSIARVAAGQCISVHCLACWENWRSIRGPDGLIESDVLPYHWICKITSNNWSILLRTHFDEILHIGHDKFDWNLK